MYSEDELLPLSGLQHLAFCERRWALVHLEQQWEENVLPPRVRCYTRRRTRGRLSRGRGFSPGELFRCIPFDLASPGKPTSSNFCPVVRSSRAACSLDARAVGAVSDGIQACRDQAGSAAYRIQLCAQALCLEEMLAVEVPAGAVFDGKAKRRTEAVFDGELRAQLERLALRMHEIYRSRRTPTAVFAKKCDSCSMKPVCLPAATGSASASEYLRRFAAANLRQTPPGAEDPRLRPVGDPNGEVHGKFLPND